MSGETGLPSINRPSLLDTIETKLEESKGYEGDIGADASGLMVLQQSTFLNLLEATPDIIAAVMRHLHEEATSDAPSITDVKIVAYVDDCPSRAFMSWSYRSVTLQPETGIDFASEDTVTASFDMYSKLVDLGKLLSDKGNSESDVSNALDELKSKYAAYLPSNDRVKAFTQSEKIMSLDEYVGIFDRQVEVKDAEEDVWPAPGGLVY